ncbi:type I-E CRISPR-associated protein Cse1/CasA [Nonomuraea sp. NPDC048826]|uniref:type I-E CRISPR-associated protein Cse1/CasA n=1 Tax=Nonomuraea sp. NPDC048826 TaxID=3364347 RepID=UPI0037138D11
MAWRWLVLNDPAASSFDLTRERWLPVQRQDGREEEVSLREIFTEADDFRRVVADVPTQEFALLRLLLAIVHDTIEGPQDLEEWQELWGAGLPVERIHAYLDQHRDRFDLLDPAQPFFQTPRLETTRGDMTSLDRLVADVPNGAPFFTMRARGVDRLSFAEAARWVVHAHAYDTSGIKTGVKGDPLVKGGKAYPRGVGWAGRLGGVLIEGANLRQTLLLNLIAFDTDSLRIDAGHDRPAWRRPPTGPGQADELELARRPAGLRDLYTWQSRRIRLAFDAEGVYGAILTYGDPLEGHNKHQYEPMTGWRRSEAQEKKLSLPQVYMPREHDKSRSAWRGLAALVAGRAPGWQQRKEAERIVRPRILGWAARLAVEGELPLDLLIRARLFGAEYGTQQSVIDEIIDDAVAMPLVLLYERDQRLGQTAIDAVGDAEDAVSVLGDFAAALARAAGAESDPAREAARSLGFSALDGPFRDWLMHLAPHHDPDERRATWQGRAHRLIARLADELLRAAGDTAWEGRVIETKGRLLWLNASQADLSFRFRLRRALPMAAPPGDDPGTGQQQKAEAQS